MCDDSIRSLGYDREPQLLYYPIKYTLDAGGKRLRPVILLSVCDMFGGGGYVGDAGSHGRGGVP